MRGRNLVGVAAGAAGALAILAAVGLGVVYSGAYDIAATEEHTSVVRWAFDTTFRSSIERRAAAITPPAEITPGMVAAGGELYRSACQHCHGGPGAERADWAAGMRPRPPHLTEAASEWRIEQVYWLVKHGAKMTGMPAFGSHHDDATLWGVAAFVGELPAMTPERYARHGSGPGSGAPGGHGH